MGFHSGFKGLTVPCAIKPG